MQGLIVFKKRELWVVEPFLEKALKAYPDAFSFAVHKLKTKKPNLICEINEGTLDLKQVMEIQNEHLDDEVLFWLLKADGKQFMSEDIQPFICLGGDDAPLIVGMSAGKFDRFIPSASEHMNDYIMFNKYIIPKLAKLGKDQNEIFNALADDINKMDFDGLGGTVALLSDTGRMIPFGGGLYDYEWGWSTDKVGYEEEKIAPPKPTVVERVSGFVRKTRQQIDDRTPIIASVESIPQPPKTMTADPKLLTETSETFTPSSKTLSNKQMKQEYEDFCLKMKGYRGLPNKEIWKNGRPWTLQKTLKDFKDLDKYASVVEKDVVTKILPIMSPASIQAVQNDFKDRHSEKIPDPDIKAILADMEKHPTFWDEFTNIPKTLTDGWDWEDFRDFGTKYTVQMCKLAWSYRNELLSRDEEYEEPQSVDTSGTGVVKETAPPKPAQPSIVPAAPAAPGKKQRQMLG